MATIISCKKLTKILNESGFWPDKPFSEQDVRNDCIVDRKKKVWCVVRFSNKETALNFCKYITDVYDINAKMHSRAPKLSIQVSTFKSVRRR